MNDFSQKMSVLRRMLGKGQKAIAADIGVKQETISKWELGKMPIPHQRMDALARSLGCETADFMDLPLADLAAIVVDKIAPPPKPD